MSGPVRLRHPRVMLLLLLPLLVVLSPAAPLGAEPEDAPPTQEELRARYKGRKAEEKAHGEALEAAAAARAEELAGLGIGGVTVIRADGDPARSVDIAFIGDGFAAADQEEWEKVVTRMVANFDTPPFDTYAARVNLYRVDLVAAQSGTTIDDPAIVPPLAGTAVAFPGGKLLRCDVKKAAELTRKAVPHVDYLMVVLNTHGKFLGSANSGAIVTLSTAGGHQRSIVVHEFAHNFGGLYDEYVDPKQSGSGPPPPRIARGINVSLNDNVHLTKWHHFNIPEAVFRGETPAAKFTPEDNVRCYEGGATFPDGVYRAEENCHMQRGRGKAFCRVCTEALELALYRFFPPVEAVAPAVEELAVGADQTLEFAVTPVDLGERAGEVRIAWYADGVLTTGAGRGRDPATLRLPAKTLGVGTHHVTVTVDIDSPRVHLDRGRLSGSFTWTVEVGEPGADSGLPERIFGDVSQELAFTLEAPAGWALESGPAGADFDPETGVFLWTPAEADFGGWRATFVREPGGPRDRTSVLLAIRSPAKRRNLDPKPLFLPPHPVRAGESLSLRVEAFDPDGDHLAWSATGLPPGAALDPNTGIFTWSPGPGASGLFEIPLEANDGVRRAKTTLRLEVERAPLFRGIFRLDAASVPAGDGPVERYLLGLHHPNHDLRLAAARALTSLPAPARLAEALRLCREISPQISPAAFEHLAAIFAEAAERGETWHLEMFLSEMPRRIWQFVDRPDDLERFSGLCDVAAAQESLSRDQKKGLDLLRSAIEAVRRYRAEKAGFPVPPAIRDKKYR